MSRIIKLKTKGDVSSLITGDFNGLITEFIVPDKTINKRDKILYLFSVLLDNLKEFDFLFEGKIDYSFRNKRIDIVIFKYPVLLLCNFSDLNKVDKKSLELDKVIENEKKNQIFKNIIIYGCLFLESDLQNDIIKSLNNILSNKFLFLNMNNKNIFDLINSYVISN